MYGMPWTRVVWIGIHLVLASTHYPSSWNCSTQPEVPCIAYDVLDDSKLPESEYFCLDDFPLKYSQVRSENGTVVSWSFQFNDTLIDGFCVETSNLWRVLLLQHLELKSFPFALNLTTRIADDITDDDDDDDIKIHPLMTQSKKWNHVTKYKDFYVRQISSRILTIVFTSDTAIGQDHVVERFMDNCDSNEPAVDIVRTHSNEVTFPNMTFGNYCFMFTPQEPYPLDPVRCLCYYGSATLRQCSVCARSSITYIMKDLDEAVTETVSLSETVSANVVLSKTMSTHIQSNDFPLVPLLGSLGGCLVVFLLIVVGIVYRQHIWDVLLRSKFYRRNILILATYDTDVHRQSMECLSYCLKTYCRCNVHIISNDAIGKETHTLRNVEQIMSTFDVVIIILSQKLLSLFEETKCSYKDNRTLLMTPRIGLVEVLLELLQSNSQISCKIVTLHFCKSPKCPPIANILSASDFHLVDDFKRLLLQIHNADRNLSKVSRQCSKMMTQLHNIDTFSELKYLVSSVALAEMSTGDGKTNKPRLQNLNVDSGQGSLSLSRVSIGVNSQMCENIHNLDGNVDEFSNCSVWSDSGRKHHDLSSLHHYKECLNSIANCECDVCSLATIGEFSV